jgi:hypothetical protein
MYVQVRFRSTDQENDRCGGPFGPENPGRTGWVSITVRNPIVQSAQPQRNYKTKTGIKVCSYDTYKMSCFWAGLSSHFFLLRLDRKSHAFTVSMGTGEILALGFCPPCPNTSAPICFIIQSNCLL